MSFEESPSLDLYKDGLPENLPDPSRRRALFRILILASLVLVFGLALVSLWQNGVLAGTGSVTGAIFDDQGRPVQAELSVAGSNAFAAADENGFFVIDGVPAGDQSLVVGYRAIGREVRIRVVAGQIVDIGEFRFMSSDFQTSWGQPR